MTSKPLRITPGAIAATILAFIAIAENLPVFSQRPEAPQSGGAQG